MANEAGILSTIGKTPMVVLNKLFPAISSTFYAKLEMFNPGGSTKDRTAFLMLSKAVEEGELGYNSTVIESSSGNMAIGLAQVCRYLDSHLIVVTDPNINRHTLDLIRAYGARIDRVTEANSSGNYLKSRLQRAARR
jgi:N-(2-amino-2-carboxyethyl)-L-glutamate synthase